MTDHNERDHGDHDHGPGGHNHDEVGDEHSHPSGVRGALRAIFRPHSHDGADSIDTALEASERGIRAVKISFAGLVVTSIV